MRKQSQSLKPVLACAIDEATARGDHEVGAEHLLLALTRHGATSALLSSASVTHVTVSAGLLAQYEQSLVSAGLLPRSELSHSSRGARRPGWGASVRLAIDRGRVFSHKHADHSRMTAEHELLIGILSTRLGTVARTLTAMGVDREGVLRDVEESVQ